ncbi:MAG: exonuclease domain-containing protein [Chitinophagales bacterium]|nr:exonuclease domain-containing protein [Chitinophagales bacterium]MDW8428141.1 exonuclease domain-containing protein [Chitinophagales bacterium]
MYSAIDVETTGLHAGSDAITEIAVVNFDQQGISEYFHTLVQPGRPVPYQVTRYNGITQEMLTDAPGWNEIMAEVDRLTRHRIVMAHNAHFDYNFLRAAFAHQGLSFERKVFCTLYWHRRLLPGLSSYSLPSLCRFWGIATLPLHRALADALAVMHLFLRLLGYDTHGCIRRWLQQQRPGRLWPPQLSAEVLRQIPQQSGVYYLKDGRGKVLYVGKARNLRQRILQHFTTGSPTQQQTALISRISDIQVRVCGSELMALLLEAEEIRRLYPPFNRAQKRTLGSVGLFSFIDGFGYKHLVLKMLNGRERPLAAWPSLAEARNDLKQVACAAGLCPKLAGLQRSVGACYDHAQGRCDGACIGAVLPDVYNLRVEHALMALNQRLFSGLIVTEGRDDQECGVVALRRGFCLGFGFVPRQQLLPGADLYAHLHPVANRTDTLRIIAYFLRQNHRCQVVPQPVTGCCD